MLADEGRGPVGAGRRVGEVDQGAELSQLPEDGVGILRHQAESLVVGVVEDSLAVVGVDGDLDGHSRFAERMEPGQGRACLERRARAPTRSPAGRHAGLERLEPLKVGAAQHTAELRPFAGAEGGHLNPALLGLVQPATGRDAHLVLVEAGTNRAGLPVHQEDVGAEDGGAVEERRPQVLSFAGTTLVVQGGEHPDHRHQRVGGVGHAEAEIEGWRSLGHRSGLELQPAGGLVERIEPAEFRERALGAVGVRVAVHEVGVARPE